MSNTTETISLLYPITHNGEHIDSIEMRRPKAGEIMDLQKRRGDDAEKELAMFASLTGLAPDTIRELDIADYVGIQETYQSFLSSRQTS